MAELTGFEPAVSCVTGRHVGPLHHSSIKKITHPTDHYHYDLRIQIDLHQFFVSSISLNNQKHLVPSRGLEPPTY
jgi:hypothetical protein